MVLEMNFFSFGLTVCSFSNVPTAARVAEAAQELATNMSTDVKDRNWRFGFNYKLLLTNSHC